MESMLLLLGIIAFVYFIILPIWSYVKISSLNRSLRDLSRQLLELDDKVRSLEQGESKEKVEPQEKHIYQEVEQKPAAPVKKSAKISEPEKPTVTSTEKPVQAPQKDKDDKQAAQKADGLEENLASKWFVWIGAAAIALAGIFLVKYIADRGILTPAVRMVMAFVMGVALALGGE